MSITSPDFAQQEFRRSSYSGENGNNCVEVARRVGVVGVRDSKVRFGSPDDFVLTVPPTAFAGFLAVAADLGRDHR